MVRGRHLQTGGRPVDLAMLLGTRRCGLTVFPSNPAPPPDGAIWRRAFGRHFLLDEVMRVGPHNGISIRIRRRGERGPCLCQVRTHRPGGGRLKARRRAFTWNQIGCRLDLGSAASRSVRNKFLLFKPPRLWNFVRAARAN